MHHNGELHSLYEAVIKEGNLNSIQESTVAKRLQVHVNCILQEIGFEC